MFLNTHEQHEAEPSRILVFPLFREFTSPPLVVQFPYVLPHGSENPQGAQTRCGSGPKGVDRVNRFTLSTPFSLDSARFLVITCGQPYSYSFPQSPHSQLPTFHPLLGLPTFRMFYLMVAKTLHFPFSRFRFVLPISHFPFRSVHVPLYILMGGT